MRDQVEQLKRPGFSAATKGIGKESDENEEQLKRPGFSAATKGIGKESDENEEKLLSLFAKLFSEALRAGFPNYG